jgi:FkbM family methyltransferase
MGYIADVHGLKFYSYWTRTIPFIGNLHLVDWNIHYEDDETEVFIRNFRPEYTFLDVGAHSGYFTVLAAALGCRTIHAFEPNTETLKHLYVNILLNDLQGIIVHDFALFDRCCTGHMKKSRMKFLPEVSDFNLKEQDAAAIRDGIDSMQTTRAERFDDVCKELGIGKVDFVKMDIEGAEASALEGMQHTACPGQAADPAIDAPFEDCSL